MFCTNHIALAEAGSVASDHRNHAKCVKESVVSLNLGLPAQIPSQLCSDPDKSQAKAYHIDCADKAFWAHGFKLGSLCRGCGPHNVAVPISDWQKRQGTVWQEHL